MRTRRSWRNQNRLWRALGGPPAPKPVPSKWGSRLPTREEVRAAMFPKVSKT